MVVYASNLVYTEKYTEKRIRLGLAKIFFEEILKNVKIKEIAKYFNGVLADFYKVIDSFETDKYICLLPRKISFQDSPL
ncbi:hypothetical protein KH400_23715, partial [Desertibacillus haloalkaliphilus]|nr:hypothetical protein [Desertibacillus haloalkaliphilus]